MEPTVTSQFPPSLAVTPCSPRRRRGCGSKDKEKKAPPQLPVVTAVLKIDMRCDGCASVRRFPGVEGVSMEVDRRAATQDLPLDIPNLAALALP